MKKRLNKLPITLRIPLDQTERPLKKEGAFASLPYRLETCPGCIYAVEVP